MKFVFLFQNKYSSLEHAAMVAVNAKRALAWLKERPANTKGVTSKGTTLASLAVTTEEDSITDGKNNDDLILDVCLNLSSKDRHVTEERRGDLRVVKRDVVLLTDDRNLKLKAHTTDVPVNTIPDFVRWAFPTK
jgi:protein SMG6